MEVKSVSQNLFGRKIAKFTEIPGLRCAMCDNPLLKMSEVDAFINRVCGQNASLPSNISISRYMDTMGYQKESKMELLGFMEHYAKIYPEKSFGEIFALPDVLSHHLGKSHAYYAENYERCKPIFESMEKNLKLTSEQKTKLDELHKKAVNISIGNRSNNVKRYLIMQNYGTFQREVGGIAVAKIQEYARRIPLMPGSPDLILSHMAGRTDTHIMQGLLSRVTPMKKRILPTDGHGIFICQPCATEAGLVPFKSLFFLFPNMYQNLQKQLNTIISALINGHLRGNGDYPKVIQRLIAVATDGEKILDLGKYNHLKRQLVKRSSQPLCPQEVAQKKQDKVKRFENMLLRETPENVKGFLISAEKRKRELLANGATPEQIKAQDNNITLLRKIYISLLRRDKLI